MSDSFHPGFSRPPIAPGTCLNGIYEIDQAIGSGGMGEIYRGHAIQTGDAVAIKMIRPEFAENQAALALFRKEASALHHLHHDAIVRYYVFTVEPTLQRLYLAMEFVDGPSLSDLLRRGPLGFEAARSLMRRVAAGLHAAHERGVIHRDVSPDNIIIPGGDVARAKIIDFGIARSTRVGDGTIIGSGFAGKYNYVSPEQLGLNGGEVTAKSDIYSLGLVLAEALTGRAIDMGGSQLDIIDKRRSVPNLGAVDVRFRPLLERMLQPDPAGRPESMAAVAAWPLGDAAEDRRPAAEPRRIGAGSRPASRMRRLALGGALVLAAAVTAVTAVLVLQAPPPMRPPAPPELRPSAAGPVPAGPGRPVTADASPPPAAPSAAAAPLSPSPSGAPAAGPMAASPAAAARPDQGLAVNATSGPPPQLPPRTDVATVSGPDAPASPPPTSSPSTASPNLASTIIASPSVESPSGPSSSLGSPTLGRADRVRHYIEQFDGGDCFFVTPVAVGETAAVIEGFGDSTTPFEALNADFQRANGFDASIGVRQVTHAQCPAIAFLARTRSARVRPPRLELGKVNLRGGDSLTGTIDGLGDRNVELILVSDSGTVQNLTGLLKPGTDAKTFNIGIQRRDGDAGAQPQLLIAVASEKPLDALRPSQPIAAAEFFPSALSEAARKAQTISAAARYFKLEK